MAAEQTGRMNPSIDSRSDLYSLGVTLYEMFTGMLSFSASDPIEWVHCHIARRPMPPSERRKEVVVNLIPELELIIGKQQPVAEISSQEVENGFQTVLRAFLGVFAKVYRRRPRPGELA